CPGSGGWSDPKPNKAIEMNLPKIQLYHLATDISEGNNVFDKHPEKVKELYELLMTCIDNGRSTEGEKQINDVPFKETWTQYEQLLSAGIAPR
ncbi:MAG: hypothetical protein KAI29_31245, partial [Cyclobacteriaceae bacterium]|nr:hypothetical protein [Cyclobacteriaceae bacterium]